METLLAPEIILYENNASCILQSTRKRFVFEIESNAVVYLIKNISRTSVVSSANFRSILIFASCVVGTCNILYE